MAKPLNLPPPTMQPATLRMLGILHAHGPMSWMDLDYRMHTAGMRERCRRLAQSGHVKCVQPEVFEITAKGRKAIGIDTPVHTPSEQRICNANQRAPYQPEQHNHMGRVGLARY